MSDGTGLRSIAVFGGGVTALAAAIAFARALPRSTVTLVTMPIEAAAFADTMPTAWHAVLPILERLGIDDRTMIATGSAIPSLAWRFDDWSLDGRSWSTVNGPPIPVPGPGALHQRWLDAVRAGTPLPFHALFPSAVLADSRATTVPDGVEHGLAFDQVAFGDTLAVAAHDAGVRITRAAIAEVDRGDDGSIRAIYLTDGRRMTADLFIDATGPNARLAIENGWAVAGRTEEVRVEWTGALPCDRLLLHRMPDPATSPIDAYGKINAGWSVRWSDPRGLVHAVGYLAATTDKAHVLRLTAAEDHETHPIVFEPGRRRRGWTNNILTLGDASVQPGPLGRGGFTLALAQLDLALDLLPNRSMEPLLIAEYNRRAAACADRMRDFLAAFYWTMPDRDGVQPAPDRDGLPPALIGTLAQFAQRGTLPHHDDEIVSADAWRAVLLGQGIRPRRRDPVAAAVDPVETRASLEAAAVALRTAVDRLPTAAASNARLAVRR
ncbi:tryptophan 7-halogenase [Sphingomonas faeni]|uniref:tryptophan 7-halogenase n=1 Tax=Sphingomonas faeni TaxID=185950 RepID=UPI00334DFE7F